MCNVFLNKDSKEAWDYFNQLAENVQSWDNTDRSNMLNKTKSDAMIKGGRYHLRE